MNIPDIQTLLQTVKNKNYKLLCVGAGDTLQEACVSFRKYNFYSSINYIFDTNVRTFCFEGHIREVLPTESIVDYCENSIVYIVSLNYYIEIYNQLDSLIDLKKTACYIHNHVKHVPVPYNFTKYFEKPIIPKVIHYCWFGKNEIPEKNKEWMSSWGKYCPDYKIVRWDESNYDCKKNKYIKEAYECGKYAFVSDYARIDILYHYGGIYLDNDVELFRSLDDLLYNNAFAGTYFSFPGVAFGLGVGSVKGFPMLKEMMDVYDEYSFVNEDGSYNITDCLYYQTKILNKYGYNAFENTLQYINGMTIYPTDVLAPMDVDGVVLAKTMNTVSMHHFDASWFEDSKTSVFRKRIDDCREFAKMYENRMS